MRAWVEQPDAPFPPRPLAVDVPKPLAGATGMSLEFWKQRRIDVVTWTAVDMLFNKRQMELFKDDMDVPRPEDTSLGRQRAAAAAGAAAAGDGAGGK